jgi:RNA polymerase II transcription mediator complex subunit 9
MSDLGANFYNFFWSSYENNTPNGDIYLTLRLRIVTMPPLASSGPPTTTSPPEITPFPSPQTFDILPEIYALVSRLHLPTSATTDPTTSQPIDSLSPKDLPAAIVPIKLKIQKARAAVQALPDVGRTVEEQQREIRALEKRNESLRKRVQELAGLARQARGETDTGD